MQSTKTEKQFDVVVEISDSHWFRVLHEPPEVRVTIDTIDPLPLDAIESDSVRCAAAADVILECEEEEFLPTRCKDFANAKAASLWILRHVRRQIDEEIDRLLSAASFEEFWKTGGRTNSICPKCQSVDDGCHHDSDE